MRHFLFVVRLMLQHSLLDPITLQYLRHSQLLISADMYCRLLCWHCVLLVLLLQLIWPGLFARHGGRLQYDFDLSTLSHLSEGYATGALLTVGQPYLA